MSAEALAFEVVDKVEVCIALTIKPSHRRTVADGGLMLFKARWARAAMVAASCGVLFTDIRYCV